LVPLFAAFHVAPNAVSLTGMLFGILAGFAYYHYADLPFAVAGFVLMIAWHVMDGADGQLARLTHAQSELGKILDGICDYVTFIAVYVGLALALSHRFGERIWILVVVSGICHAVQSAAYEAQRQEYAFWGLGRASAKIPDVEMASSAVARSPLQWVLAQLYRQYVRLQWTVCGITPAVHNELSALLDDGPAPPGEKIRARYREVFAPTVRRWSILSSNYRTLGIFAAALLKAPEYYFCFEIAGFGAILIVLLRRQRRRYAAFLGEFS
ncbi:MAG: CDP-alcohol phosphatidyltransferase family protein, partial [Alphaproteobacteria bacterium]|nr:CDP-alcohol phosphatidyltransferase family protein [Alphaproteobacteria bacterium]